MGGQKVKVFARRLEQLYHKLQEKFPGKYDIKQLKDRLFYGMSQHLQDSMHFLYKKEDTSYEELLEASQEAKGKWTESKMARVKNASVPENESLKALRDHINALASTISATNSPKKNGDKAKSNGQAKPKRDCKGKPKPKGPDSGPNGPFQEGQRPIQCFKCGGWGHTTSVCPSQGNHDWSLNGVDNPPTQVSPVTPKKQ